MKHEEYFNAVYDETYDRLLKYLVIKTNSADDVPDILQEVYRMFYQRIKTKGYHDIDNPHAFLVTSVNKELSRYYAKKQLKRNEEMQLSDEIAAEIPFEPSLEANEAVEVIWDFVRKSSPDSYKTFTLFYGFDMSIEDIAKELGTTAQAIKSRLHRTRNEIRRLLKGEM